jgi:hypothetical protein
MSDVEGRRDTCCVQQIPAEYGVTGAALIIDPRD